MNVGDKLPPLPRFGVEFRMPEGNERFEYFGMGPYENYPDKRHASWLSRFKSTVSAQLEDYVKPQENMAHGGTHWAAVTGFYGHGLLVCRCGDQPFSINCSHYDSRMLTAAKHNFELTPLKETVVCLDYRHNGVGSNSCGPELAKQWRLDEKEFDFSIRVKPMLLDDTSPFEELCGRAD